MEKDDDLNELKNEIDFRFKEKIFFLSYILCIFIYFIIIAYVIKN